MNGEKPSFWTTLPGILTGIAALLGAIGGLIVIWQKNQPAPDVALKEKPAIVEKDLSDRLDALNKRGDICPHNSWFKYVLDYTELGEITSRYITYLGEYRRGDRDGVILDKLRKTFDAVQTRNVETVFDKTELHSKTYPSDFPKIFDSIQVDKRAPISDEEQRILQAEIQTFYTETAISPDSRTGYMAWCRLNPTSK